MVTLVLPYVMTSWDHICPAKKLDTQEHFYSYEKMNFTLFSRSLYTRILSPKTFEQSSVFVRVWRAILWLEYDYIKSICMKDNHWNISKSIPPTSIFFLLSYFITCTNEENRVQSTKVSARVQKEYGDWLSQGPAINTLTLFRTVP